MNFKCLKYYKILEDYNFKMILFFNTILKICGSMINISLELVTKIANQFNLSMGSEKPV